MESVQPRHRHLNNRWPAHNETLYSDYPTADISLFDYTEQYRRGYGRSGRDGTLAGLVIGTIAGVVAALAVGIL